MLRAQFGGGSTFEWQPTERGRAGVIRQLIAALKAIVMVAKEYQENSIDVSCGTAIYAILYKTEFGE